MSTLVPPLTAIPSQGALRAGGEVPVYSSHLEYERGVRCGKRWSPISRVARWTPSQPGDFPKDELFSRAARARDLNGCLVLVAPLVGPPFVISDRDPLHRAGGLDIDLVHYFARAKNVTVRILPPRSLGDSSRRTNYSNVHFSVGSTNLHDIYRKF